MYVTTRIQSDSKTNKFVYMYCAFASFVIFNLHLMHICVKANEKENVRSITIL